MVQVVLLQHYTGISHLRIRYSNYDNTASCIVGEIKTFTYPSPANSHENGTRTSLFKYTAIIPVHSNLKLWSIFGLSQDNFWFFHILHYIRIQPVLVSTLENFVWRKEHQNSTRGFFSYANYWVAKISPHHLIIPILITEVKRNVIFTFWKDW